jgi:hypothetical protein
MTRIDDITIRATAILNSQESPWRISRRFEHTPFDAVLLYINPEDGSVHGPTLIRRGHPRSVQSMRRGIAVVLDRHHFENIDPAADWRIFGDQIAAALQTATDEGLADFKQSLSVLAPTLQDAALEVLDLASIVGFWCTAIAHADPKLDNIINITDMILRHHRETERSRTSTAADSKDGENSGATLAE